VCSIQIHQEVGLDEVAHDHGHDPGDDGCQSDAGVVHEMLLLARDGDRTIERTGERGPEGLRSEKFDASRVTCPR
jgi:hypothetical protein